MAPEGRRKKGRPQTSELGDEQLRKREHELDGSPGMKYGAQPGIRPNGKGMTRPYAPHKGAKRTDNSRVTCVK